MRVGEIMTGDVKTVSEGDTFAQAARVLREHGISSVVVRGERGPAGIVTERDVVSVLAEGLDPAGTKVGDRMSHDLATVAPGTDIAEAAALMGRRGIRHLPVVDRGELVGIVSIRDLMSWAVQEMTAGHELADIQGSSATLTAAVRAERQA